MFGLYKSNKFLKLFRENCYTVNGNVQQINPINKLYYASKMLFITTTKIYSLIALLSLENLISN